MHDLYGLIVCNHNHDCNYNCNCNNNYISVIIYVHVGLPEQGNSEPKSALFRFVKKNSSELQAITNALATVRSRDDKYRGTCYHKCVSVYVGVYEHVCMYMCMCLELCLKLCLCISMCIYIYVCMMCMCVCMHMCMCVCAGLISIQKDVPYLEEDDGLDKHKLDIYFPRYFD